MPENDDVSIDDMIAEIKRELTVRSKVYPSLTSQGKLKPATAELQVRRLEAALALIESQGPAVNASRAEIRSAANAIEAAIERIFAEVK